MTVEREEIFEETIEGFSQGILQDILDTVKFKKSLNIEEALENTQNLTKSLVYTLNPVIFIPPACSW